MDMVLLPGCRSECTAMPTSATCRLTVEVAGRLVQLEAVGTLHSFGPVCIACVASASASCAMLANWCSLSPADCMRVAAVAATALGSGRSVMQSMAQLSGTAPMQASSLASDLLDNMQYCIMLATSKDILDSFVRDVAPPGQLLSWLRDAAVVLNRLGSLNRAGEPCVLEP